MKPALSRLKVYPMSWTNPEIALFLGLFFLGLYIFHNHRIRHISRTRHKPPPTPNGPSPISLQDVRKLHHYLPECLTFNILHHLTWRKTWGQRYEQRHMVPRNVPFQNLYLIAQTDLSNQLRDPNRYLFRQDGSPIFRVPHKMLFDIVLTMRRVSIKLYAANYTKVIT